MSLIINPTVEEQVKYIVKTTGSTQASVVTEILVWALNHDDFSVDVIASELPTSKRGRKPKIEKMVQKLDSLSPQQLEALKNSVQAAMAAKR